MPVGRLAIYSVDSTATALLVLVLLFLQKKNVCPKK